MKLSSLSTVPLLIALAILSAGCDPAHTSYTYVTIPPPAGGTSPVGASGDGGEAGVAAALVAAVARDFGFEPNARPETGRRDEKVERLQSFTTNYEAYPGKGLYHSLYIDTAYRPDDRRFEVYVTEFVASRE